MKMPDVFTNYDFHNLMDLPLKSFNVNYTLNVNYVNTPIPDVI